MDFRFLSPLNGKIAGLLTTNTCLIIIIILIFQAICINTCIVYAVKCHVDLMHLSRYCLLLKAIHERKDCSECLLQTLLQHFHHRVLSTSPTNIKLLIEPCSSEEQVSG